jgi:hypothetical protein
LAIFTLIDSGDTDVVDRSLKLDQGMSVIVLVRRERLAVGTEIRIMAYGAFVANAFDIGQHLSILAERTVTIDTIVTPARGIGLS